jgi:hypothetical protein
MRLIKVILIISTLVASIFVVFKVQEVIIIRQINCKNQYGECSEQIKEALIKHEDQNIKKVKSSLSGELRDNLLIQNYYLQYGFPKSLDVFVVEVKPKFAVKPLDSNNYFLIDNRGYIISLVEETKLPILEVDNNIMEVGQLVDKSIIFSGEILYELHYSNRVEKGLVKNDGFYVNLSNGIDVIFPLDGEKALLLGSLFAIQNKLKSDLHKNLNGTEKECTRGCYVLNECRKNCEMDLRFQNPVIR